MPGTYDLGTARGRIELDASDIDRAAASLDFIGRRMLGAGLAGAAGFGYAIKAAGDFEQQLSRFSAISDSTEGQMEQLRQKALQLGRDSAYGATEVVDAFVELAKAGFTVQEVLDGVGDAAVTLAAAGEITMAQATDTLAIAIRTFNLEAKDATHVADLMAGVANASLASVEDLSTSFKYAAPVAHTLGVSIDDLVVALGLFSQVGIRGSTAGTSLRGMFVALTAPSEKAANEMKRLGIITADGSNKFFDATGKAKGLGEMFQILQDATRNLTPAQRNAALATIFQRRALAAAAQAAFDGEKGFNAMKKAAGETTAEEVMNEKLDNLNGSLKILKASLQTAAITFGELFTPYIKVAADVLRELVNWFIKLPDPVKKMIGFAVVLGSALLILGGGLLLTASMAIRAYRAFQDLKLAFTILRGLMSAFGGGLASLGSALGSLLLNPVFLVIAALALLAFGFYYAYTHSETFRNAIQKVWEAIQTGAKWVWNFFKNNWPDILALLMVPFTGGLSLLIPLWRHFGDTITEIAGKVAGAIGRFAQRVWHDLTNWVGNAVNAVVDFFTKLPGRIVGALAQMIYVIRRALWEIPMAIAYMVGFVIGLIVMLGVELVKAVITWTPRLLEAFVKFTIDFIQAAIEWGVRVTEAVIGFMTRLPGIIWNFLVMIATGFANFVVMFVQKAIEWGTAVLAAVVNFFSQLPGRIAGFLSAAFSAMVSWVGNMIAKAIEVGGRVLSAIVDFFSKIPGEIGRVLAGLPGQLFNIGVNMLQGFLNGLKSLAGKVTDFVKGLAGKVIDGFKKPWELFSPSRKMKYMGEMLLEGLVVGMDRRQAALEGAVKSVTDIVSGMDTNAAFNAIVKSQFAGTGVTAAASPAALAGVGGGTTTTTTSETVVYKTYDIDVVNPEPEPAGDSIYRTLQKVGYLGGEDE